MLDPDFAAVVAAAAAEDDEAEGALVALATALEMRDETEATPEETAEVRSWGII